PFDERLEKATDGVIASSLAGWDGIAGPEGPKKPEVVAGGPYLTAMGDASLIRYDMALNSVLSTLGVLFLFLFAYRRFASLAYAFVPLICGMFLTFAFSEIAFGSLNSATSVVAGLLIGLGVDFVIVSYGRFIEERRRGATLEEALLTMTGSTGRAVLVGAVTTTATFYAFAITDFTGLRQMGLLTGTGILFCAFAMFCLLPAMLAWSEDHHERRQKTVNHFLHSFGSDYISRLCLRHKRLTVLLGVLLTIASAAALFQLDFDESMKTMRPKGNRGIDVAAEVGQRFGSGFDSMTLLISADSPEEVIELSDRASEGARKLVRQGILYGYSGVTSLIPSPARQAEALGWLDRERGDALNVDRVRSTFAQAIAAEGLRLEPFEPGLDLFSQAVQLQHPIGVQDFAGSKQTQLLLDRFLKKTGNGWRGAVYLYPPSNRWRREAPPEAVKLAENLGPKVVLAGTNVINQRVRTQVIDDAWVASILGVVLVALLIWMDFRSLRWTLYSLIPLVIGLLWMGGGMVLFGIPMNFINIFVTTMIIGIGVDYGVHVLHRYREVVGLSDEEFESGLLETGKAVVAASLSTIVGFGSLIFSHYPGLQSTGKVAILGALSTCLVSITLLPVALTLMRKQTIARQARKAAKSPQRPSSITA
ncbi:MAG TPA: MMPL family transporter, partial [Thermoanaerobaculia bacterium]|nr:MMPL family transporter [Thermoanaerobaculia bacterium]